MITKEDIINKLEWFKIMETEVTTDAINNLINGADMPAAMAEWAFNVYTAHPGLIDTINEVMEYAGFIPIEVKAGSHVTDPENKGLIGVVYSINPVGEISGNVVSTRCAYQYKSSIFATSVVIR